MVHGMSDAGDFDFQPRLGRIRSQGRFKPKGIKAFLKGARKKSGKIGSGGSRTVAFAGARRVMIKARVHRLSGGGGGAQRAHISYLERDGAGKDREPAEFYDELTEGIHGQEWLKEHSDERHHFRFIVSPEDGEKLKELKPFVRDLVSQMEIDLETKLDWIAVDHHNTEHPHTHIVMSGKRDDGQDLVIPKDYLSHGMRERGSALLSRELGLQTSTELSAKLDAEIGHRKVTRMDRVLMREMHRNGAINLSNLKRNRDHYQARLNVLRELGLAQNQSGSIWSVDNRLGVTLNALDKSDTIARRIERAVRSAGVERGSAHELGEYDPGLAVQGRLLKVGYDNELLDRRYAVVDGLDGRAHYFDLGVSNPNDLSVGDMVEIKARSPGALNLDQHIADVASNHRGIYSLDRHRASKPDAGPRYFSMIENRLGSLERAGLIERFHAESFFVKPDFIRRVDRHFAKAAKRAPNIVRKLEGREFENQIRALGETWLDQQLAGVANEKLSEAGLGGDVRHAMEKRMKVLADRGLVKNRGDNSLNAAQLKFLRQEGLTYASLDYAKQSGKTHKMLEPGEQLDGTLSGTLKTPNGKFAIVDRGREFSLVPWKPSLERLRGREIEISMSRSHDISWTLGRSRGLSR